MCAAAACAVQLACSAAPAEPAALIELTHAERVVAGSSAAVTLPDTLRAAPGAVPPLAATYRLPFNLEGPLHRLALCTPGLIAHARIRVNGGVVDDRLGDPLAPPPRSIDRIRMIELPEEMLRKGENLLEIEATGRDGLSVAPFAIGPRELIDERYRARVLGAVVGPACVAVVVASLALCMLVLWARRGDAHRPLSRPGRDGWLA